VRGRRDGEVYPRSRETALGLRMTLTRWILDAPLREIIRWAEALGRGDAGEAAEDSWAQCEGGVGAGRRTSPINVILRPFCRTPDCRKWTEAEGSRLMGGSFAPLERDPHLHRTHLHRTHLHRTCGASQVQVCGAWQVRCAVRRRPSRPGGPPGLAARTGCKCRPPNRATRSPCGRRPQDDVDETGSARTVGSLTRLAAQSSVGRQRSGVGPSGNEMRAVWALGTRSSWPLYV